MCVCVSVCAAKTQHTTHSFVHRVALMASAARLLGLFFLLPSSASGSFLFFVFFAFVTLIFLVVFVGFVLLDLAFGLGR